MIGIYSLREKKIKLMQHKYVNNCLIDIKLSIMKQLVIPLLCSIIFISCKKSSKQTTNCFSEITTMRTITDKLCSIRFTNNKFFIIEQLAIDTKLLPCNLPEEFKVNGLQVTVSGDIKSNASDGPCCTENFVITKIVK